MGYGEYFSYKTWEDWARNSIEDLPVTLDELKKPEVATVRHGQGFGRWGGGRLAKGRGAHINPLVDSQVSPVSGANAYFEYKVSIRRV